MGKINENSTYISLAEKWFFRLQKIEERAKWLLTPKQRNDISEELENIQVKYNNQMLNDSTHDSNEISKLKHKAFDDLTDFYVNKFANNIGTLEVKKLDPRAVIPTKAHDSDTGYDITFIDVVKEKRFGWDLGTGSISGGIERHIYKTGLAIKPPEGYYVDMVPRSGFSKTGFICGNSFGVIDSEYRGELMASLWKLNNGSDSKIPDLELMSKYFQLIIRKKYKVDVVEVNELDSTERGDGGFGSTGK